MAARALQKQPTTTELYKSDHLLIADPSPRLRHLLNQVPDGMASTRRAFEEAFSLSIPGAGAATQAQNINGDECD